MTKDEIENLIEVKVKAFAAQETSKIVEDKVKQGLALLKFLSYIAFSIVTFFTGLLGWLLADKDVRQTLVSKYVFSVADELAKPAAIDALDKYMNEVLAYSYSARFSLGTGGSRKSFDVVPFYKTTRDRGKVSCIATYPNNSVKNPIIIRWNDQGAKQQFEFEPGITNISRFISVIPSDSTILFGERGVPANDQKIKFEIADTPLFDQTIADVSVECTILIVGAAKYRDAL